MKKWSLVGAMALLAIAVATLQTGAAGKLKIGFVYLGPIGDFGWTYQHEVGRRAVVAAFGDRVETTYLENVPEGPDAERSIEQLARAGHRLIFAASFGYMDPVIKVAAKYPNVHLEHATVEPHIGIGLGRFKVEIVPECQLRAAADNTN